MTQQEILEIIAKKDFLEKKVLGLFTLCDEKDESIKRLNLNLNQSTSAIYQLNLSLTECMEKKEQLELEVGILKGELDKCRLTLDKSNNATEDCSAHVICPPGTICSIPNQATKECSPSSIDIQKTFVRYCVIYVLVVLICFIILKSIF